jgi:hypothetical protein
MLDPVLPPANDALGRTHPRARDGARPADTDLADRLIALRRRTAGCVVSERAHGCMRRR